MIADFLRRTAASCAARLRDWDPNTDPSAEPVSVPALLAIFACTTVNLLFFFTWRYQPMQDFPLHVACAKYVAEWGRSNSPYTGLFERPDLLAANTLLYSLGGALGKVVDVLSGVRFIVAALYIVGLPLATLYALRVFGRSSWGAVLSAALVFDRLYVAGFVNELIAAPMAIFVLARFYLLLREPSIRRALILAVGLSLVVLAHSFVFMWIGAVIAALCVAAAPSVARRGLRNTGMAAVSVLISVIPSLLLFARWTLRSSARFGMSGPSTLSAATFIDANEQFRRLIDYLAFSYSHRERELLAWLILLVGFGAGLARLERRRSPPVLELACVATFFSYFLLPVHLMSEGVVSERQLHHAMWLLPAFATPVAARTSRLARWVVVAGILLFTVARSSYWHSQLVAFERDEASGLDEVLAAAPPGLRMHYPRINVESKILCGKMIWHIEAYYVAAGAGLVHDVPGADDPRWWLHFRPNRRGLPYVEGQESYSWPLAPGFWDAYDLTLVHAWRPPPEALAAANSHATRLARSGEWELWRTNR